jgi:hypothetical protein
MTDIANISAAQSSEKRTVQLAQVLIKSGKAQRNLRHGLGIGSSDLSALQGRPDRELTQIQDGAES